MTLRGSLQQKMLKNLGKNMIFHKGSPTVAGGGGCGGLCWAKVFLGGHLFFVKFEF